MSSQETVYTYLKPGTHRLTVPAGFSPYVLVYAWGAGGGKGSGTSRGSAGGFAFTPVEVQAGDDILIAVGGRGGDASGTTQGSAGVGLQLRGSTTQTFTASAVSSPTQLENGYFTRSAHAESNPSSNVRQYYVVRESRLVYSSTTPPPAIFRAGTYRGSVYSRSPGLHGAITTVGGAFVYGGSAIIPGGGDNLNAFDLVFTTDDVSLRGGKGGLGRDEDNDSGSGAGGGGATAVFVNDIPYIVAAGGGGGGGYGDDRAGGATVGYPGGIYPGTNSISPWYPVSDGRWGSFINQYGIWVAPTGGTKTFQIRLDFPVSGTYTFQVSSDNNASWRVDSGTTYTTSFTAFSGSATQAVSLSAGSHTIYATISNPGDVGGWAMRITKPDSSELWHTRKPANNSGLNYQSAGADGLPGGGGSGAGGGGYPYGGAAGKAYGDDNRGSEGGNGGQIYVSGTNISVRGETISPIVETGTNSGAPGGVNNEFYPGSSVGYPGSDGGVIIVFVKSFQAWIKESGDWKKVENAWVKVDNSDPVLYPPKRVTLTSSGRFVVPSRVVRFNATIVGGGGGGASGGTKDDDVNFYGGGGGGGGSGFITNTGDLTVVGGQVFNITIGSGGLGGKWVYRHEGAGDPGTKGGSTTLVDTRKNKTYTAAGGNTGTPGGGGDDDRGYGVAGTGGTGGTNGSNGTAGSTNQGVGGAGGNSSLSTGGAGGTTRGVAGKNSGAGAGGGGGGSEGNGGAGGSGYVIIEYQEEGIQDWKKILRGWVKVNGDWKAMESGVLSPFRTTELVDEQRAVININLNGTVEDPTDDESAISATLYNYSLFGKASRLGYVAGKTTVNLTLDANTVISSNSVTDPALVINGFKAGDTINIVNNGLIKGSGNIGIAILAEYPTTVTNNGTIIGGNTQVGNSVSVTPDSFANLTQLLRDAINNDPLAITNAWYVTNPPLQPIVYNGTDIGTPEFTPWYGKDLFIDLNDDTVYTSTNETQTTVTSGDYTYTRGSLAYSGSLDLDQFIVDELSVTNPNLFPVYTFNVYNYSYTVGRNAVQGNTNITWSTLGTISGGTE